MRYLRLVIQGNEGRKIYQKDFEVETVFETLIHLIVNELVKAKVFSSGDYYSSSIIPGYGTYKKEGWNISKTNVAVPSGTRWISLRLEGAPQSETPISFFTVEMRNATTNMVIKQDFEIATLDFFFSRIEQALIQIGLLTEKSGCQTLLYVRDDEDSNFEQEIIFRQSSDADLLIELTDDEKTPVRFENRALASFEIQETVGAADASGSVSVLLTLSAKEQVLSIAMSGLQVEQGGMLIGQIYQIPHTYRYLVVISDILESKEARGSFTELRYTFESWQQQTIKLKEQFPEKRIVGWYHTHLVKMQFATTDKNAVTVHATQLFFSRDDAFMHKQFFREKWYVAMVLDPQGNMAFFHWDGVNIAQLTGYHLIADHS